MLSQNLVQHPQSNINAKRSNHHSIYSSDDELLTHLEKAQSKMVTPHFQKYDAREFKFQQDRYHNYAHHDDKIFQVFFSKPLFFQTLLNSFNGTQITYLNLEEFYLTSEQINYLSEGFKFYISLEKLSLKVNHNHFLNNTNFFKELKNLSNLNWLSLNGASDEYDTTLAIANYLANHKTLTTLTLRSFQLGDDVMSLIEAINQCISLTELDLSRNTGNFMCHESFQKALQTLFKSNKSLTSVNLSVNKLRYGICDVAKGLLNNKTLSTLYLHNNMISYRGMIAITKLLSTNQSLRSLYLGSENEDFGSDGKLKLNSHPFHVLPNLLASLKNCHLSLIDLSGFDLNGYVDKIADVLADPNLKLTSLILLGSNLRKFDTIKIIESAAKSSLKKLQIDCLFEEITYEDVKEYLPLSSLKKLKCGQQTIYRAEELEFKPF